MQTEFEIKFLDIDHEEMISMLQSIGAKQLSSSRTMRRIVYDIPGKENTKDDFQWVRLRDEGDVITLTYKHVKDFTIDGVEEVLIEVNDFDSTRQFLKSVGYKEKSYQVTRRETWKYKNTFIELDEWPHLPMFLELDGPSETEVREIAGTMDFNWEDGMFGNVDPVYEVYFDVENGHDITRLPILDFETPLPDELESKRKNS